MSGQAPEIPGFQPLNIRGGGELGIWIEARQVRLDRKVLLKVLPASESHLSSDFQREVQGMVQLDGRGTLRVIEEGQAGQARFVALDEAGGARPVPGQVTESEIYPLAVTLLSLYLESADFDFRPGRIPVESLRRLPAGGFAVCELGKISKIPKDGTTGDGRAQISETLRRWSRHLEITAAVEPLLDELRQEQVSLQALREQWQQKISKETGNSFPNTVASVLSKKPAVLLTLFFVVCVVSVLILNQVSVVDPQSGMSTLGVKDLENPKISEKKAPADSGDSPGITAGPGVAGGEGKGIDPADDALGKKTDQFADHSNDPDSALPDSLKKISAVDWQRIEKIEQLRETWEQIHEQVDPGFMLENRALLLRPDWSEDELELIQKALLLQESRYLAKQLSELMELCRQGQFESARGLLDQVQSVFPEREFSSEVGMIRQSEEQMSAVGKQWDQQQKLLIEALLDRGEFIDDRLPEIVGLKEIPRFANARRALIQQLEKSWSLQKSVIDHLRILISSESVIEIPLADGDLLKGRLQEVSPQGLVIKPTGRRDEKIIRWQQLRCDWALSWLESEDPRLIESRAENLAILSLIWGGLVGLDRGDEPEGLPSPLLTVIQACRDLRRMESLGKLAERASLPEVSLRTEVESLVLRFSSSVWSVEDQRRLENWWISPVVDEGPSALGLFSGSDALSWKKMKDHFELEVIWNSGKGIEKDWGRSGPGRIQQTRGGGVLLRGEIPLESPLLFEDRLTVKVEGSVTVREKPNLNVVLWTGGELPLWFGLGLRPPGRSSYTSAGETVLLPAHGIIKAPELDLPDTQKGENPLPFPLPIMGPRLDPGQILQLRISDNPEETSLELGSRTLLRIEGEVRPRRGGISFQTFESPVLVRGISVTGWVSTTHWRSILLEKARNTLWKRP